MLNWIYFIKDISQDSCIFILTLIQQELLEERYMLFC